MIDTDFSVKILLQKCYTETMEKLALENECKIEYKKAQQFYNDLGLYQLC